MRRIGMQPEPTAAGTQKLLSAVTTLALLEPTYRRELERWIWAPCHSWMCNGTDPTAPSRMKTAGLQVVVAPLNAATHAPSLAARKLCTLHANVNNTRTRTAAVHAAHSGCTSAPGPACSCAEPGPAASELCRSRPPPGALGEQGAAWTAVAAGSCMRVSNSATCFRAAVTPWELAACGGSTHSRRYS